ncbi:MAG: hypothetical protein P1U85_21145 [Verrucomicrobiales bacterium]|nr:hypothetical protein [Verrucomicrobiales bacterium]
MAGGGSHWWHYVLKFFSSDDDTYHLYIESKDGLQRIRDKKLVFGYVLNDEEYLRQVERSYDPNNNEIFVSFGEIEHCKYQSLICLCFTVDSYAFDTDSFTDSDFKSESDTESKFSCCGSDNEDGEFRFSYI